MSSRSRQLATLVLWALWGGFAVPRASVGQPVNAFQAYISKVKGEVARRAAQGDWEQAVPPSELVSGDRVRAGQRSRAIILYADKTKLVLREQTEALLTGDGPALRAVQINQGDVTFDVQKQESEQFRFTSPTSVAAIRGTTGAWTVLADGTSMLNIFKGVATLTNTTTGASLDVAAGHVGISDADGNLTVRRITFGELRRRLTPSVYVGGLLGFNTYGGDRDLNPADEVSIFLESFGVSSGLEVGYQVSPHWAFAMTNLWGKYPRIDEQFASPAYPRLDQSTTSEWRNHLNVVTRYFIVPRGRFSPYAQTGFNVSFGKINNKLRAGGGPMAGFGVETGGTTALFIEFDVMWVFGDEALDLAAPISPANTTRSDAFTFWGFGVRHKLNVPI